jgi:hypothetical protein
MATNRPDTLDPALLRPGRLDRKVEFGLPDLESRTQIFQIHTRAMACERDIRFELLARLCPNSTGADIRSVCTEAVRGATGRGRDVWVARGGTWGGSWLLCLCVHAASYQRGRLPPPLVPVPSPPHSAHASSVRCPRPYPLAPPGSPIHLAPQPRNRFPPPNRRACLRSGRAARR